MKLSTNSTIDINVLKGALIKPLKRVEWVEVDQISKKSKNKEELSTH